MNEDINLREIGERTINMVQEWVKVIPVGEINKLDGNMLSDFAFPIGLAAMKAKVDEDFTGENLADVVMPCMYAAYNLGFKAGEKAVKDETTT